MYFVNYNGEVSLVSWIEERELLDMVDAGAREKAVDGEFYFHTLKGAAKQAKKRIRQNIITLRFAIADINADLKDNKGRKLPIIYAANKNSC